MDDASKDSNHKTDILGDK